MFESRIWSYFSAKLDKVGHGRLILTCNKCKMVGVWELGEDKDDREDTFFSAFLYGASQAHMGLPVSNERYKAPIAHSWFFKKLCPRLCGYEYELVKRMLKNEGDLPATGQKSQAHYTVELLWHLAAEFESLTTIWESKFCQMLKHLFLQKVLGEWEEALTYQEREERTLRAITGGWTPKAPQATWQKTKEEQQMRSDIIVAMAHKKDFAFQCDWNFIKWVVPSSCDTPLLPCSKCFKFQKKDHWVGHNKKAGLSEVLHPEFFEHTSSILMPKLKKQAQENLNKPV